MITETCGRCGGSGRYSYNQLDADMCYGCRGRGTVEYTPEQIKAREYHRKKLAEKNARIEAERAERAVKQAAIAERIGERLEARYGHLNERCQDETRFGMLMTWAQHEFGIREYDMELIENKLDSVERSVYNPKRW